MGIFGKSFGISLGIQAAVIADFVIVAGNYGGSFVKFLALPGLILDTAYVVYGVPSAVLSALFISSNSTSETNLVLVFALWLIPAVFYSFLIGLVASLIGNLLAQKSAQRP